MKKLFALLIALVMVVSFAACDDGDEKEYGETCGCGEKGATKYLLMDGDLVYFCDDCADYLMDETELSTWSQVQDFARLYLNN